MAMTLTMDARNALAEFFASCLDGGTMVFETSGDSEVATCTFGDPAFGSASNGVATANAITPDTDAAGGIVDHVVLVAPDTSELCELTATVTGGGGDVTMSNLTIGNGDTVEVTGGTITWPES